MDVVLVVGARNSSNSNRLREIGHEAGKPSYLINDPDELERVLALGVSGVISDQPEVLTELMNRGP